MQTKLLPLLLTHAPLVALIGNRIAWDRLVQGSAQGSVVMYVISGVTDYTMASASGYVLTRVQIDSRGSDAAKARAIAEEVEAKLSGYRGTYQGFEFQGIFMQGQRTRFDKDGPAEWFTDSRDYLIHWAPA
jgi:hypothetical protein